MKKNRLSSFLLALSLTLGLLAPMGAAQAAESRSAILDGMEVEATAAILVDTTYGSHVMYFIGTDLPAWAAAVTDNLQTEDTNKWNEELTKDAVTEQKDFGMKFVG